MSRIYFHSPSGEAELRGSERAWMGCLVNDLAEGLLRIHDQADVDRLLTFLPADHYLRNADSREPGRFAFWANAFRIAWSGMFAESFTWRGQPLNTFSINLNTVLKIGSDPVKLAARLHAQCEIHAWVDGPNRAWLAGIIEDGLESGVCRQDQGWDEVLVLLRSRDDEPVVTSYSVCDQFPYRVGADEDEDGWNDLSFEQQWEAAMSDLRADTESGLELKPDDWKAFNFRHGLTMFDINAKDMAERIERALVAS